MERIEIRGLEIVGPNQEITLAEAQADRLVKSKKFLGRGIVAWSGKAERVESEAEVSWPQVTTSEYTRTRSTTVLTAGSGWTRGTTSP